MLMTDWKNPSTDHDERLSSPELSTLMKLADLKSDHVAFPGSIQRLIDIGFIRRIECMRMAWVELTKAGEQRVDDELAKVSLEFDELLERVTNRRLG